MPKTFNVLEMAQEETITVELRDGRTLKALDLLPEVVDKLGTIVDNKARKDAQDEVQQRAYIRTLTDDTSADDAFAEASAKLTELTTSSSKRNRQLTYEQLAVVLVADDGKPITVKMLQQEIPLPVAQKLADEFSRIILGRKDSEGNAEGSDGDPSQNGSTS